MSQWKENPRVPDVNGVSAIYDGADARVIGGWRWLADYPLMAAQQFDVIVSDPGSGDYLQGEACIRDATGTVLFRSRFPIQRWMNEPG